MNRPSHPTLTSSGAATPLLLWNQLPQDRRQELTAILAVIVLKQLSPHPSAPSEVSDEQQ